MDKTRQRETSVDGRQVVSQQRETSVAKLRSTSNQRETSDSGAHTGNAANSGKNGLPMNKTRQNKSSLMSSNSIKKHKKRSWHRTRNKPQPVYKFTPTVMFDENIEYLKRMHQDGKSKTDTTTTHERELPDTAQRLQSDAMTTMTHK